MEDDRYLKLSSNQALTFLFLCDDYAEIGKVLQKKFITRCRLFPTITLRRIVEIRRRQTNNAHAQIPLTTTGWWVDPRASSSRFLFLVILPCWNNIFFFFFFFDFGKLEIGSTFSNPPWVLWPRLVCFLFPFSLPSRHTEEFKHFSLLLIWAVFQEAFRWELCTFSLRCRAWSDLV